MRPTHEANVTNFSSAIGAPDVDRPPAGGVWTLASGRLTIAERDGPVTMLVPTEQVRLLAVDLPLANRAKRLEALPFAVEDLIAEPVESVHLALGAEIGPRRYLVGVVGHELMAGWVERAEEAGLGQAAIVPDALALPRPATGQWAVDVAADRAVVRSEAGFALPAAMLRPAWEAAGKPFITSFGEALPEGVEPGEMGRTGAFSGLAVPALDLRQGLYSRQAGGANLWRKLAWILVLGAAAHVVIATADTLMLQSIADRREADTRALVALAAPGTNLSGDLADSVITLLPTGSGAVPDAFLPLLGRVSSALTPLGGAIVVRSVGFEANMLTMEMDGTDPALAGRIDAALRAGGVAGSATRAADGSIRLTARGA
ncbi:type II secretion system protein GspL [Sphingomonas sp. M1-B02]|uniref:type II secretion system protein GspL n=1 Tax=Sphingomonas sp. M1-B02 TaxID=3114300 RepID=UPI0022403A2D|nr:type II secretion system protein GspL [Sphingomonas sp. S6-11]UZK67468.1 type II secretion system protein GspL [Sphingomonas sp. S6-11]